MSEPNVNVGAVNAAARGAFGLSPEEIKDLKSKLRELYERIMSPIDPEGDQNYGKSPSMKELQESEPTRTPKHGWENLEGRIRPEDMMRRSRRGQRPEKRTKPTRPEGRYKPGSIDMAMMNEMTEWSPERSRS